MNTMSVWIPVCALVAQALLILLRVLKVKKVRSSLGMCKMELPRNRQKLFMVIALCAPLLAATLFIRSFSLFVSLVFAASSVLVLELSVRHLLLCPLSGIYDQWLIYDDRLIARSSIERVALQGETTLRVICAAHAIVDIHVDTPEVRDTMLHILEISADD